MTLKELIRIIVQVVERYFFLERQKVLALYFDQANRQELMEAAKSINGRADCFSAADLERAAGDYDIVFVDYIPAHMVAEPALGLCVSPWGKLMAAMFIRSKPVFQLKKDPDSGSFSPACRALLKEHWLRLASLGVVLLDSEGGEAEITAQQETVYTGNVLSRGDVNRYAGVNKIVVGNNVLVTSLAGETARELGIELIRQK
ncbi:MAG: hypothetical protein LBG93_04705 [Treponema sp.]|jgi:hypothetical protein|nr:hypothetical protein [Treponema sp.]